MDNEWSHVFVLLHEFVKTYQRMNIAIHLLRGLIVKLRSSEPILED